MNDVVNSPSHYCRGGYELGPILYAWGISHRRASAVEYIMRAGAKDPEKEVEDLRKAIRNLEMELEYMERYGRQEVRMNDNNESASVQPVRDNEAVQEDQTPWNVRDDGGGGSGEAGQVEAVR